ncbi:MAG TPA: hypothetical protein ENJ93_02470, partial [Chloroflexi bacterium]|nr:hypothetical protein [Chloroflexota bacterium]
MTAPTVGQSSATTAPDTKRFSIKDNLAHRYREFSLIARDPVLLVGLLLATLFILTFIFFPIVRVVIRAFF